jgi:hypothetical protein
MSGALYEGPVGFHTTARYTCSGKIKKTLWFLCKATLSNVYLVVDGNVYTPAIQRKALLRLNGKNVRRRRLSATLYKRSGLHVVKQHA